MKTHTSRWAQNSPRTWILKARAQDGGAVLGTVEERNTRFYVWTAADTGGWAETRYAAQRAVRRALAKEAV